MSRPEPGALYAFRTKAGVDRHAVLKIIGVSPDTIAVAVLAGVWKRPPTLAEASDSGVLAEHRFAVGGRPALFGLYVTWWDPAELLDQRLLGMSNVSPQEAEAAHRIMHTRVGCSYGPLTGAAFSAEAEWRWLHDREAYVAEVDQYRADMEAARLAREERFRTRLDGLTWEQLLAEDPLAGWASSPPFPSAEFTDAVRATLHDACRSLQALGLKPRKTEVRAVLKACVLRLNDADAQAGEVIETEEREDLCIALEEMAFVARQPALIEEIEDWKTW